MCLGFAGAISLGIGLAWASMGFWLVFLFVLAECAVLIIAFLCYSLHAADFEKVVLTEKTGEAEFRLVEGADEFIQLEALLAAFILAGKGCNCGMKEES